MKQKHNQYCADLIYNRESHKNIQPMILYCFCDRCATEQSDNNPDYDYAP
jgi:hypothetical protein